MIPTFTEGTYNIYFLCMCLKDKYRKTASLRKLIFSFLETIEVFATSNIYFSEITTLAYSTAGKSLCKSIGLKKLKNHKDHGDVYWCNIQDILKNPLCNKFET